MFPVRVVPVLRRPTDRGPGGDTPHSFQRIRRKSTISAARPPSGNGNTHPDEWPAWTDRVIFRRLPYRERRSDPPKRGGSYTGSGAPSMSAETVACPRSQVSRGRDGP